MSSNFNNDPWKIWPDKDKSAKIEWLKIQYEEPSPDNKEIMIEKSFSVPVGSPWYGSNKRVTGSSFYCNELTSKDVGNKLDIVPEPENIYDKYAVKVMYNGNQIGHLGQKTMGAEWMGTKVSKILEQGYTVEGRITYIVGGCDYLENLTDDKEILKTLDDKLPMAMINIEGNPKKEEKVCELIRNRKWSEVNKMLGTDFKNKGIGYSLFVTAPENKNTVIEKNLDEDIPSKPRMSSCKGKNPFK